MLNSNGGLFDMEKTLSKNVNKELPKIEEETE